MRPIFVLLVCGASALQLSAQSTVAANAAPAPAAVANGIVPAQGPLDYVCPMDADVRSDKPGTCPRCGMTLRLGIPDPVEYPLELTTIPTLVKPGQKTQLKFIIRDPKTNAPVTKYEIVHEKLFHMFIVSGDLKYFLHDHPVPQPDGSFIFEEIFPKAGMYRVVADVYPFGGTPQLIARTVFASNDPSDPIDLRPAKLTPDVGTQKGENTELEVSMIPPQPIAGTKTMVFFKMKDGAGLEKYLGAWGHMLIASDDTVDLIHEHPFLADGGPQEQFNIIFPRAHSYRVWLQFQRKGVVNTIAINVPVVDLEHAGSSAAELQ